MAVVMNPREKWTDERLDDLSEKVDGGFAKVDSRFNRLETRIDTQFAQLNDRFDRMQLTLFRGAVGVIVTLIGSTTAILAAAFLS